jgi:hypothetical protein
VLIGAIGLALAVSSGSYGLVKKERRRVLWKGRRSIGLVVFTLDVRPRASSSLTVVERVR